MLEESSIVFIGVAPHPPIMVPEVGCEAVEQVRGSVDAMRELTARLINSGAETLVIISPHAPLDAQAFVAYYDPQLRGSFARFGAQEAQVSAPFDSELFEAITSAAGEDGYQVVPLKNLELDHGTAVPLYFLLRNGWRGRVVALGYSFLSNEDHLRFGACLKRAAANTVRPVALVASGDLSHRLTPDAPAGFYPQAHLFDEEIVAAVSDSALERIVNIDQGLRHLAGECGYRSMLIAIGAAQQTTRSCEVLHYEAPFGVGYMVAQLARA